MIARLIESRTSYVRSYLVSGTVVLSALYCTGGLVLYRVLASNPVLEFSVAL